jgi:biopolymer transport protein ExbB/TolQ
VFLAAVSAHGIDDAIFHVADALEVPVLVLTLLALVTVVFELGGFIVEVRNRSQRALDLDAIAMAAQEAVRSGERARADEILQQMSRSAPMTRALGTIARQAGLPGADHRLNKALADFDFDAQRRLARTRILVRAGPALGLMGTLIPLSPALTGLAQGNVSRLSQNLRVAFSVTVLGLLVGAIAFAISLQRDRMYGKDLSDLEFAAAVVNDVAPVADPVAEMKAP